MREPRGDDPNRGEVTRVLARVEAADRPRGELVDAGFTSGAELVVLLDPFGLVHHRRLAANVSSSLATSELFAGDDHGEQRQSGQPQNRQGASISPLNCGYR